MRRARVGDHWRHVYERSYSSRIRELLYANLQGLGSGKIELGDRGITAICGANGVGKTTLLKALLAILDPGAAQMPGSPQRLRGCELIGSLMVKNSPVTRTHEFDSGITDPPVLDLEVEHVDFAQDVPRLTAMYLQLGNLGATLDAIEPRYLTADETTTISYVVGKDYSAVHTFELDLGANGEIWPYFRVTCGDVTYGTETMGLGELSAHFALWHLQRASKNSVLLLEEPETFLAPRSQVALLDAVAKYSEKRSIWTVLTTHSPVIMKNIPADHTLFLVRSDAGVQVLKPESQADYLPTLGVSPQKSGVVFVEDKAARELAKAWIGHFAPHLVQELEFRDVGDESKIQAALTFPRVGDWLTVVGLFDGDGRDRIKAFYSDKPRQDSRKWPYAFLPGENSPELVLKQVARANITLLSEKLDRSLDKLSVAMAQLEGRNPHDWLDELPNLLSTEYSTLIKALFEVWMTSGDNRSEASQAYGAFAQALAGLVVRSETQRIIDAAEQVVADLAIANLVDGNAEELKEIAHICLDEGALSHPRKGILKMCHARLTEISTNLPGDAVPSASSTVLSQALHNWISAQ